MSFSVLIVLTASLGAGAVMMCWTVWTIVMKKTAAKVGVSVTLNKCVVLADVSFDDLNLGF